MGNTGVCPCSFLRRGLMFVTQTVCWREPRTCHPQLKPFIVAAKLKTAARHRACCWELLLLNEVAICSVLMWSEWGTSHSLLQHCCWPYRLWSWLTHILVSDDDHQENIQSVLPSSRGHVLLCESCQCIKIRVAKLQWEVKLGHFGNIPNWKLSMGIIGNLRKLLANWGNLNQPHHIQTYIETFCSHFVPRQLAIYSMNQVLFNLLHVIEEQQRYSSVLHEICFIKGELSIL